MLAATHSLEYEIPSVKVNDEQAAFDATEYLIRQGHHQIGMISGSMLDPISGLPRIQGFLRALRTHGIDLDPDTCIEYGSYHFNDGYEAVKRLHKKFPEMTAVLRQVMKEHSGAYLICMKTKLKCQMTYRSSALTIQGWRECVSLN